MPMEAETLSLQLVGLPLGHTVHRGRLEFQALDAAGDPEPCTLDVVLDVDHLGSRLHVRAAVTGAAQSSCHRCLARFDRPVAANFAVTLQKGVTQADSEDIVAVPENVATYDFAPHVREAVILEEPIRVLCRPDCRGLCASCGSDLNVAPCGCAPSIDPRWAALAELRQDVQEHPTDWRSKDGPAEA
jgi:uncharacterized protein